MPRTTYTLRIERPEWIDDDTLELICANAQEHDTTLDAKIQRWVGGLISDAEDLITTNLPDGWYAKISGGES